MADGRLQVVGVIQEQHAERGRLYAQWQKLDWPIAHDPVTRLGLAGVPIAILIDEHGIVRNVRPTPDDLNPFCESAQDQPLSSVTRTKIRQGPVDQGDDFLFRGPPESIDPGKAIQNYRNGLQAQPRNASLLFRLGGAYRMRYDSPHRQPQDFQRAAENWTAALTLRPNQYIWRRRIEQYGPRSIKPYPFYNWVEQATREIAARGEQPVKLAVPLTEAELARPNHQAEPPTPAANPDPENRINLDSHRVTVSTTVVPAVVRPGGTVRVHLQFRINGAKWNNESQPLLVWIESGLDGSPSRQRLTFPSPEQPASSEDRSVEFEFVTSATCADPVIRGFALFHACDDETGQCRFLRTNIRAPVTIRDSDP